MNIFFKLFTLFIVTSLIQVSYAGSHGKKTVTVEDMILNNSLSSLSFVSIKKGTAGEVHTFDKLSGSFSKDGELIVKIDLSSVNTGIDIRNERMQNHLFETEKNPTATISAKIGEKPTNSVSTVTGTLTLNLHGIKKDIQFDVIAVTSGDMLVVSSKKPIMIQASDFGMVAGIQKLQELAKLPSIATAVPVYFVLTFTVASNSPIAKTGKEAYNKLCLSCHLISQEKGVKGIAPPIFAVKHHLIKAYPNRDDFIQTVIDWVEEPSIDTSLMPGAVKKFGLMPKLPYSASDVRKTAEFIYDTNFVLPDWYKRHYKEKHGGIL